MCRSREVDSKIVVALEREKAQQDRVRTSIESQIATLLAYRKSLIHECVTGQRRVMAADVARAEAGHPRMPHE